MFDAPHVGVGTSVEQLARVVGTAEPGRERGVTERVGCVGADVLAEEHRQRVAVVGQNSPGARDRRDLLTRVLWRDPLQEPNQKRGLLSF